MRWPPDPWTMVAPLPGATVGAAPAKEGPSLSNSPSHRANHIATATLAAHPYRPLYLSGVQDHLLAQMLCKGCDDWMTQLNDAGHLYWQLCPRLQLALTTVQ